MNVASPDKKSVMMYVMCYFQVLPHADIVIEDVPALAAGSDKSSINTGAIKPNVSSQVRQSQIEGSFVAYCDYHRHFYHRSL